MTTKRQKEILDFIEIHKKKKGYAPSFEEIKKKLKLKSVSTIHYHIKKLENLGLLHKGENKPRSLDVYEKEKMINVPLLGMISAGQPIEAIQDRETIAVPQSRVPRMGEFYALRVVGDSMIDENIHNGDIILAKYQNTASNGEKVVALIDGYEATLKKFYKERGHVRLQPANEKLEPIIIQKNRELIIQGIVIDVIKNEEELQTESIITSDKIKRDSKLPLNKIILGDAIQELRKLPNDSCDVVVVDPPYNIGKDFGNNIDKREFGEYVEWCKSWINECIRVMKPTGTLFIYGFSEILAHLSVEIPINKRWLIWHYTNKNVASLHFWQRSHESIICAWKDKPVFNRDDVREPYTDGFLNGAAGKKRKATAGRFSNGEKETVYKAHEGGALPRDVIKVPALAGGAGMTERWFLCKTCKGVFEPKQLKKHREHDVMKHPTQKPLEITRKLIKSSLPQKGGVVLIPFVGTGSECVVAKELEQNYIGFEINPDYIKIAQKWLKETKVSAKLF
ncbi:MAG TPA: transcriptional repressor LexA [Candidatus Kaiserbacteria bacterium]|nr:transcriptional repressor LexA [Candidatus Kaiserbacteria bacterium]